MKTFDNISVISNNNSSTINNENPNLFFDNLDGILPSPTSNRGSINASSFEIHNLDFCSSSKPSSCFKKVKKNSFLNFIKCSQKEEMEFEIIKENKNNENSKKIKRTEDDEDSIGTSKISALGNQNFNLKKLKVNYQQLWKRLKISFQIQTKLFLCHLKEVLTFFLKKTRNQILYKIIYVYFLYYLNLISFWINSFSSSLSLSKSSFSFFFHPNLFI